MDLEKIRIKIDEIDNKIVELLNERFNLSSDVKDFKIQNNLPILNLEREKNILKRLDSLVKKPFQKKYLTSIYKEIFACSRDLQEKLKIAFFGLEQSYTHLASQKFFGKFCDYFSFGSIAEVFAEVEKKNVKFGVVPAENSTEGIINHTFDLLVEKDVQIYSEIFLNIHHNLLSTQIDISKIKKVYSHSQALAQSRDWLAKNLPGRELVCVDSTSLASKLASEEQGASAIASVEAAETYNLQILAKNIEDKSNNKTKFWVISLEKNEKSLANKTSIIFSIKDKIGALYEMLVPFRKFDINLTKIESRPTKKKAWEYIFFVDFLGHRDDEDVKQALNLLEKKCLFFKILGSYPVNEVGE